MNDPAEREMRSYDSHKNTTEARQGDRKTANMRVLVIAMAVLAILFALIWWIYSLQTPPGV